MSTIPTKAEKCKGSMLGTAIGDALGWPNEPRSKNRTKKPKIIDQFFEWTRSSNKPRWHDEKILPGEYSDDTQLTLCIARSIIAGDWEKFFVGQELPFWLQYERGGGNAMLKAAKSYKNGCPIWQSQYTRDYFSAGGNGAIMRILPHVIASAQTFNITKLMIDVIRDTLITHGHPRAFLGATCYAYALDYLLRKDTILAYGELVTAVINGQNDWGAFLDANIFRDWLVIAQQYCAYDFRAEWESTLARMLRHLELVKISLEKGGILDDAKILTDLECFGHASGAGDVAALVAIYLASRYANNPTLGVKIAAFSFGADTDTIASITGGLLGMLSGTDWIPAEWRLVQDYDALIQITELLLADNKKEATKKEVTEAKTQNNQWCASPIGKIRFIESKSVPNGKHGTVIIKKWKTTLGQTLYTKVFQPQEIPLRPKLIKNPLPMNQPISLYNTIDSKTHTHDSLNLLIQSQESKIKQQDVTLPIGSRQFIIDLTAIEDLLNNSKFKTNMTIGKILKIIRDVIKNQESYEDIAKRFHVELSVIEQIGKYVR